jgi:hypothetical protein
MGEYGSVGGHQVKLGTCEDFYYLRADQVGAVADYPELRDPDVLAVIRFRFPWPDEDSTPAGGFGDPFRGLALWGVPVPDGVDHGTVQYSASNGYLVNLPCPEGPEVQPAHVHRNGYGGACSLIQQAWRGGRLVGIARCNGCERAYRLEDGNEEAAAVAIRAQGDDQIRTADDRRTEGNRAIGVRFHLIADRLLAGYRETAS